MATKNSNGNNRTAEAEGDVSFPKALQIQAEGEHAFSVALARAQWRIRTVAMRGRNRHHDYAYARADDMAATCREALLSEALVAETERFVVEPIQYAPDPSGKNATALLRVTYLLTHVTTGQSKQYESFTPIIPEKGRPMDKATNAAKTADLSYFLRGLLLVPRDKDNPDRRNDHANTEPDPFDMATRSLRRLEQKHGVDKCHAIVRERLQDPDDTTLDGVNEIIRVIQQATKEGGSGSSAEDIQREARDVKSNGTPKSEAQRLNAAIKEARRLSEFHKNDIDAIRELTKDMPRETADDWEAIVATIKKTHDAPVGDVKPPPAEKEDEGDVTIDGLFLIADHAGLTRDDVLGDLRDRVGHSDPTRLEQEQINEIAREYRRLAFSTGAGGDLRASEEAAAG